jgi:RimJ/RimL family protein N-acetyltransferase
MIELIPFDDSHFDFLIEWSPTSEFLLQWAGPGLTYPLTHDQLSLLLHLASSKPPRGYPYSARSRSDGRIIGHGEIGHIDRRNLSAELMRILVGPPDLRGKGYGGAIVRELVRIGFRELGLHRLDLKVFDFNRSAIRCYERAGFKHEGTLREARKQGDEYWNTYIMGLLRHEWENA